VIRVVVVDDQTLVRQGIRSLLALGEGIEVVGEAADGVEALDRIAALTPDVVLLDVRMPRLDGVGVLRALRDRGDATPALMLTTFDDDEAALRALRAGAKGYLLKGTSLERLTEAVRTLAAGGTLVQPALTERIVEGLGPRHGLDAGAGHGSGAGNDPETSGGARDLDPWLRIEPLTERELEIVRLMVAGWNNKQIARGLDLSEGTVKNHVSRILAKLGVRDRTRAVLKAIEEGLVR
jgi:DNA-binding NarL/FixJ family response regulator